MAIEYRDLDLNFTAHPDTKALSMLKGDRAILRSVRNLLMTQNYEKHFHPDIGSHVTSLLFENFDNDTADRLRDEVARVLANYEPRVAVNKVQVHADPDNYGFYVNVFFFIVGQTNERSAEFFLERTR